MINLKVFTDVPNAGDIFSLELAKMFIDKDINIGRHKRLNVENLVMVGSILEWSDENSFVVGSGLIAPNTKFIIPKKIFSVRGPLTAARLVQCGHSKIENFGDLGVLAPEIYQVESNNSPKYEVGIVPHYVDKKHPWIEHWGKVASQEIKIIDIQKSPAEVLDNISQCSTILTSSLHGLIFAHALEKKALWVKFSENIIGGEFKFLDYYMSLPKNTDFTLVKNIRLSNNRLVKSPKLFNSSLVRYIKLLDSPFELTKYAFSANHDELKKSAKEALQLAINHFKSG